MSKLKKIKTLCIGCLSTNRKLCSIENYYYIYQAITSDILVVNDTEIPSMCWECVAVLHNIERFRQRVREADLILSDNYVTTQNNTLSSLDISSDGEIIDVIFNDVKEIIIEVKNEEVCNMAIEDKCTDVKTSNIDEVFDDFKEIIELDHITDNNETAIDTVKEESTIEIKECNVDIKDECVETENDLSVDHFDDFKDEQSDDPDGSIDKRRRRGSKKYKIIYLTDTADNLMYTRVKIDDDERVYWFEQERNGRNYRLMAFKCEMCISGFAKEKYFSRHIKTFHSDKSTFACDICKINLPSKNKLYRHIREHYVKYVCNVCDFQCYNDYQMRAHLCSAHKRAVECLKCGIKFEQFRNFYKHHRELHIKVTCDYCGINFTKKKRLINHIGLRHNDHKCVECDKTYSTMHALIRHTNLHHVKSARELCYCVECNIQFDNVTLYTRHLKRSVRHRTVVGVPCPECNKVYHRKHVMMNHYNHVHLKKTNHYCEKCRRYFLNGFRLRQHTASVHDKLPRAKNKMCPYCDRGFSTNRILENHIRTHTGERPFVCEQCNATFAQRQALVSHTRAIHKILNFK